MSTTFETIISTKPQRDRMREIGTLENLGGGYWNVTVEDDDVNELEELLDKMKVEYRLV